MSTGAWIVTAVSFLLALSALGTLISIKEHLAEIVKLLDHVAPHEARDVWRDDPQIPGWQYAETAEGTVRRYVGEV